MIRPARPDERAALEALQWRASLANAADRQALLDHPDAIELPPDQIATGRVIVAANGDERLGFAVVLPREDGDADLDGLFVEPDIWRSGIGRALVETAARRAHVEGARILHVVGNAQARGFYRKVGFVEVGEVQTRFGPGLAMRKPL